MVSIIQNKETLATTPLRTNALRIVEAGYGAIDTRAALAREISLSEGEIVLHGKHYSLTDRRVRFVGVGKCAIAGAEAIEAILGEHLADGVVIDIFPARAHNLTRIEVYTGTHPEPSDRNLLATERVMEFLSDGKESDLVIMLISGGGSTLLCLHDAPMTCFDEVTLFRELTEKGAPIQALNTVRKHTSKARGGGLAKAAYPAEVVSFIISDVPGNDIGFVASGPTVCDTTTVQDAAAVLAQYEITDREKFILIETPKESNYFEHVTNVLFLTSDTALTAMQKEAESLGYTTNIAEHAYTGEAKEIGKMIHERIHAAAPHSALLYAGESTVTLGENVPKGGRNQELALAALTMIDADELILPFASDGRDDSDHAGAIADLETKNHAAAQDLSIETHLIEHTNYDFFAQTGDALFTGPTGANVSDLVVALKNNN